MLTLVAPPPEVNALPGTVNWSANVPCSRVYIPPTSDTFRKTPISSEPDVTVNHRIVLKDISANRCIKNALSSNAFLSNLDNEQMERIAAVMYPVEVASGAVVIQQGDVGSTMYAVQDGVLEVYKDDDFLHVIRRDELFGELAILHHCRRTATIKAYRSCRLWAIDRPAFHFIMVDTARDRRDVVKQRLKVCQRFEDLDDNQLTRLSHCCVQMNLSPKESVSINRHFLYLLAHGQISKEVKISERQPKYSLQQSANSSKTIYSATSHALHRHHFLARVLMHLLHVSEGEDHIKALGHD